MRRLPLVVVLLFFAAATPADPAAKVAETLGPVDWIFLVDTSASMRGGAPGAKDIWTDVKVSLSAFVRAAGDRDTITLYAFDSDVREVPAATRDDLHEQLLRLEAEGDRTHLGAAIAAGLERAEALRANADPTRSRAVVLFTDGRENVSGIENPVPIDANLSRVADTFVFFVSMGEHEPQLDAFARAAPTQTTVLMAPTAESIRTIGREIRAKIPAPAPPPPAPKPVVKTKPPEPVPEPPPSPLMQAVKAAVALALLAVIAFVLIQQQRRKNRLEGEIEILSPRPAPDAAFVGLPTLQTSEVALSAILPAGVLAGSDARLFVRRNSGRKKVWIAASGGSLRINDVETPMGELHDADTIAIGDAKLRFNRAGDERPLEFNQEESL